MLFIALLAIVLPLGLIIGLRLSARIGMTISALAMTGAAWLIWRMTPLAMASSVVQAIHRSLTIALILLGAITLLKTLEATGAMARIKHGFQAISSDMRVQTVLIAFAFVCLLEGVSGFGTPAIVAAPLLIVLGFSPLLAAMLALLGDTMACTFGAVATPLLVGLENVPHYSEALVWLVGAQTAVFDLIIATLLPLGLVSVLALSARHQSTQAKRRAIMEIAPWTLMIGFTYAISAFVTVRLIGPEFTAIIAGASTLAISTWTARRGIGLPATPWHHTSKHTLAAQITPAQGDVMPLWRAWLPYGIVVGLLFLTRTIPAIKTLTLSAIDLSIHNIFGIQDISSVWQILHSPGTILLVAASAALIGNHSLRPLRQASSAASRTVATAMLALIPTLIMVQLFSNSGHNTAELPAMPVYIGNALADAFGHIWPVFAPLLGTIGAFIAGSATVSTLTMGPVQAAIAADANLPLITILALHMIGAAAGNLVAVHNVVSVAAVVGLTHRENLIMRRLLTPWLFYILLTMAIGLGWAILLT